MATMMFLLVTGETQSLVPVGTQPLNVDHKQS